MSRVVILGAGISGHTAAAFARKWLGRDDTVTVISPNESYNWIPSNIWVGVGLMRPAQVTFPWIYGRWFGMLAIAIPAGLLIGLSLGALGGGGSILTVPALADLLHQSPRAATTGSLLIVGIAALAGMAAHYRAGRVRLAQGITFGVPGVAGSYAGTRLSAGIKPDLLPNLFAGLMLAAAAGMLRRRRPAQMTARPPAGHRWLGQPSRQVTSPPPTVAAGR